MRKLEIDELTKTILINNFEKCIIDGKTRKEILGETRRKKRI